MTPWNYETKLHQSLYFRAVPRPLRRQFSGPRAKFRLNHSSSTNPLRIAGRRWRSDVARRELRTTAWAGSGLLYKPSTRDRHSCINERARIGVGWGVGGSCQYLTGVRACRPVTTGLALGMLDAERKKGRCCICPQQFSPIRRQITTPME